MDFGCFGQSWLIARVERSLGSTATMIGWPARMTKEGGQGLNLYAVLSRPSPHPALRTISAIFPDQKTLCPKLRGTGTVPPSDQGSRRRCEYYNSPIKTCTCIIRSGQPGRLVVDPDPPDRGLHLCRPADSKPISTAGHNIIRTGLPRITPDPSLRLVAYSKQDATGRWLVGLQLS